MDPSASPRREPGTAPPHRAARGSGIGTSVSDRLPASGAGSGRGPSPGMQPGTAPLAAAGSRRVPVAPATRVNGDPAAVTEVRTSGAGPRRATWAPAGAAVPSWAAPAAASGWRETHRAAPATRYGAERTHDRGMGQIVAEQRDRPTRGHRGLEAADPRTLGGFRLLAGAEDGTDTGTGAESDGVRHYLARSPRDARTVTLAAVRPGLAGDSELRERLRRKAAATAAAPGPWVVPLLDADPDAAVPWLAYSYVPTLALTEVVRTYGPLPEPVVRTLGTALADALGTLHEAGWAHGGLEPGAVALAADGPRLGGLGAARPATAEDIGADVHALGAVLAYAATGREPVAGEATPVPLTSLPSPLGEALRSVLGDGTDGRGLRGARKGPPRLSKLRSALRAPLAADGAAVVPLPGPAVATLAARASEALALESPDGTDSSGDRSTRTLRVPGPRQDGPGGPAGEVGGVGADDTHGVRGAIRPPARDEPTLALQSPAGEFGRTPAPPRPDEGESAAASATPDPGAGDGTDTDTAPLGSRSASGAAPRRSRRSVLLAGAAGTAGALVGAGAVTGWVTGRGGGLDALTDPGSAAPAADARKPPRGTPPLALWRYDLPGGTSPRNRPLVWRRQIGILVGSEESVGIDMRTGEARWSRNDLSTIHASFAISRDLTLVLDKGQLVAFAARTGERRWSDAVYQAGSDDYKGLSSDELIHVTADGRVAFLAGRDVNAPDTDDGKTKKLLLAYDTRKREPRWQSPLPDTLLSTGISLYETDSSLIIVRSEDEHPDVTSQRLSDGKREWRRVLKDVPADAGLSLSSSLGLLYVAQGRELRALAVESGKERWSTPLVADGESRLGAVALRPAPASAKGGKGKKREQRLYVSDSGRSVFCVDPGSGKEIWRRQMEDDSIWAGLPRLETSTSGKTLLVSSSSGVAALDARTGSMLWRFRETEGGSMDDYKVYPAGDRVMVTHGSSAFAYPVA